MLIRVSYCCYAKESVSGLFFVLKGGMSDMAKKKREHIVFDQMLKPKKSIPFSKVNKQTCVHHKLSEKPTIK